jgi:hypothetical protein
LIKFTNQTGRDIETAPPISSVCPAALIAIIPESFLMKAGHMLYQRRISQLVFVQDHLPRNNGIYLALLQIKTKERIMKPRDIKKAVESLQRFLLDEYGLDTKASSDKASEQPTQAELNAIFGREHFSDYYEKPRNVANRS